MFSALARAAAPAPTAPAVSIVIPTYNEAATIAGLLHHLRRITADTAAQCSVEVLVVDGGSTDATVALAAGAGATVLRCPRRGRAAQLNYGARHARGAVLYFLHADTRPPARLLPDLALALAQGYGAGCYRLGFDHPHWFLRFSAWCTRLPLTLLRFGDQSLFVRRDLFGQVGGYREDLLLLEDQELVRRLRARAPFRLLPGAVTTSARKYLANGVFRLQGTYALLVLLYYLGVPQRRLGQLYRRLVRPGQP